MKDFKKVLLIGPYPPPYGGIASHIVNLVPNLTNEGFEVFIISQQNRNRFVKEEGFILININLKKKLFLFLNPFDIYKNLKGFVMLKRFNLGFKKEIIEILRASIISKLIVRNRIQLIAFYSMLNAYSVPIY